MVVLIHCTVLLFIIILGLVVVKSSSNFTVVNNCEFKVWPAILTHSGSNQSIPITGFALRQGESKIIKAPSDWYGRLWARTNCTQSSSSGWISCLTGDCGSGEIECAGLGAQPVTLATFSLGSSTQLDYYGVSVANGYNLPMLVVPQGKYCTTTGCVLDLNNTCPRELQFHSDSGGAIGCRTPCQKFGKPEFCCSGNNSSPDSCRAITYSPVFKRACPRTNNFALDDETNMLSCSSGGGGFHITFCPDRNEWLQLLPQTNQTKPAETPRPQFSSPSTDNKGVAIFASVIPALGILLLGFIYYCLMRRKRIKKEERKHSQEILLLSLVGDSLAEENSDGDLAKEKTMRSQKFPFVGFDLIQSATQNFSEENKLGEGGFGPVYKGILKDGQEIAIKRLSRNSGQGLREFKNEITLIARLQHRNLVRLFSCCLEANEALLIYEYMPNKSLDACIFDQSCKGQLDWKKRSHIIYGIARGLCYLHEDSQLRVIHRDIKASNILLDKEMNPKISDFGMARIFSGNQFEANTNRIVGTYGYMAPEYAMAGLFSIKSDVFSFGILLLEIVCGRRNYGYVTEHGQSLLAYVWQLWHEGHGEQLMDPVLAPSCVVDEVMKCIHIGLLCVQQDAGDRPTMSFVLSSLQNENVILPNPNQPAFTIGQSKTKSVQPNHRDSQACSVNHLTFSNILPR